MYESRTLEPFSNMTIKVPAAALLLIPSDHFGIEYDLSFSNEVEEDWVSDGTYRFIVIIKPLKAAFDWSLRNDYVRIFYPVGTKFDSVMLTTLSGRLEAGSLAANELLVKSSSGKIALEGAQAHTIHVDSTSGTIELKNLQGAVAVVKNTSGSIRLAAAVLSSRLDVATTSGRVELQEIRAEEVSTRMTSGSMNVDNCTSKHFVGRDKSGGFHARRLSVEQGIEFESTSGSIEVEGALGGQSRLACASGGIKVTTSLPKESYSYDVSTTTGSVRVDGQKLPGSMVNQNAPNRIIMSAVTGTLRLDFAR